MTPDPRDGDWLTVTPPDEPDRITPSLRPWVLVIGVAMAVALWWVVR